MNYKYLIAAIVIAFVAAVAPWGARSASAASPLDGAYQTTDQLLLQKNETTPAVDVSTTYNNLIDGIVPEDLEGHSIRYFNGNDNITSNAALVKELRDSWNLGKQNWSISQFMQYTDSALTRQFLVLNYTCDESLTVNFEQNPSFNTGRVYVSSPSSNSCKQRITINWYPGNIIDIKQTTMNSVITDSSISGHYSDVYVILNYLTFASTVNYPTNYEGEPIRENYIPIEKKRIVPLTTWSYDGNTYLYANSLLDESICILQIVGTCTYMSQTTPIQYKLENMTTNEVVKEEELPAFKRFEYNEIVLGDEYKLSAKINFSVPIPGSPVDPNGTEFVTIVFDINTSEGAQNGSPFTTECSDNGSNYECEAPKLFKECYKNEFPFVDLPACIYNAQKIVNMLSFDRIALLPGNHSTVSCRQLDTLGSWISAEGVVVCPKVPVMVRDIVTPFVTIALTLMIALFIAKVGRSSN